jgi:caffeoyl-CoA O-methyltransferase
MKKENISILIFSMFLMTVVIPGQLICQTVTANSALDEKVRKFLSDYSRKWYDLYIPAADGQTLYDLIIKGNYKNALEIGTSTGHSGIWIAWALSKTGGGLSISYKKTENQ